MRKPIFGVSDLVRHKPAVQSQKMARGLKFQIEIEVDCTIHVAKTKALICVFVFAYAKSRFSHYKAQYLYHCSIANTVKPVLSNHIKQDIFLPLNWTNKMQWK